MSFVPKRPTAFKISESDLIFDKLFLNIPSFIYLCRLVETLKWIKVGVLQNFEDFCIETLIKIHSFNDAINLQNSVVPSF